MSSLPGQRKKGRGRGRKRRVKSKLKTAPLGSNGKMMGTRTSRSAEMQKTTTEATWFSASIAGGFFFCFPASATLKEIKWDHSISISISSAPERSRIVHHDRFARKGNPRAAGSRPCKGSSFPVPMECIQVRRSSHARGGVPRGWGAFRDGTVI